jgi:hypothetical protein
MDPRHLFKDKRLDGFCVYCGALPDTRDHVPAKVLLDEPFPPNLPVVEACKKCNESFSLDEQYLSCFIECVICGTTEPLSLKRANIQRILKANTALKRRIQKSQKTDLIGNLLWQTEKARMQKIVVKLARGHVAYELYPKLEKPVDVSFVPFPVLSDQNRSVFENLVSEKYNLFPELGSRAFLRSLGNKPDQFEQKDGWIIVQPGRYRYAVIATSGIIVRIVMSEYLACEIQWD